jgi:hypothetical protein
LPFDLSFYELSVGFALLSSYPNLTRTTLLLFVPNVKSIYQRVSLAEKTNTEAEEVVSQFRTLGSGVLSTESGLVLGHDFDRQGIIGFPILH